MSGDDCSQEFQGCDGLLSEEKTFNIVTITMSFAMFTLLAVVLVFIVRQYCRHKTENQFSNSVKAIAVYFMLMLLATLSMGIDASFKLAGREVLLIPVIIKVETAPNSLTSVTLSLCSVSLLEMVASGLMMVANWGLAILILFTVIAIRLSLTWEDQCLHI